MTSKNDSTQNMITEPNYTQIPNVIFDYWMSVLTPAEFKVLLCICRKTFGWQKKRDRISLRQIEKMTGLGKSSIIKNVEKLIELSLVIKIKSKDEFDGSDAPNQYEINVVSTEESVKNRGGSILRIHPPVHSEYTPPVHSVDTQKKDITKETIQKKNIIAPSKADAKKSSSSIQKTKRRPNVETSDEEHGKLIKNYGQALTDQAYDHLSEWKTSKAESDPKAVNKHTDYYRITKWVMKELKEQPNSSKNSSHPKPIEVEDREHLRQYFKVFIKKNWETIRSRRVNIDDKVDHAVVGNDKIYYDNPKAKELIRHALKKIELI